MKVSKKISVIVIAMLLTSVFWVVLDIQPVEPNPGTITVPDDYSTIQEAINVASTGDTIFVKNGTYYENVIVNKTVSLVGESKHNTIIDGNETGTVVTITQDNVNITGFTVQRSGSSFGNAGIYLDSRDYCILSENIITNNVNGIFLSNHARYNTISRNNISANDNGIYLLEYSDWNDIFENTITNNLEGILIVYCMLNTISDNKIINSGQGIHLYLLGSHNVCGNNLTSNYAGVWIDWSVSNNISGNDIAYNSIGVWLTSSNSYINTVYRNHITGSDIYGILLEGGPNANTVSGNNITDSNMYGIGLYESSFNSIYHNNLTDSNMYGIGLYDSSLNSIYHNNFLNNTEQVESIDSVNTWYDSCGNYSCGNYWSDYEEKYIDATEIDGSDVWDIPYVIDANNQDDYPLIRLWHPTYIRTYWTATCPHPFVPSSVIREGEPLDITVTATINKKTPDKVLLSYRLNSGDWWNTTMEFKSILFCNGLWTATIPGQPGNSTVEFFLTACDEVVNQIVSQTYSYTVKSLIISDLDGDGDVDLYDAVIVNVQYGQKQP